MYGADYVFFRSRPEPIAGQKMQNRPWPVALLGWENLLRIPTNQVKMTNHLQMLQEDQVFTNYNIRTSVNIDDNHHQQAGFQPTIYRLNQKTIYNLVGLT